MRKIVVFPEICLKHIDICVFVLKEFADLSDKTSINVEFTVQALVHGKIEEVVGLYELETVERGNRFAPAKRSLQLSWRGRLVS